MSVAEAQAGRMTLAEFLAYDSEGDTRYELIDGVVVAMAPGSPRHAVLAGQLASLLGQALRKRPPCRLYVGGGVALAGREDTYLVPDLAVSCRPVPARGQIMPDPELVVEILSPSTEAHDRKVKLRRYREIAGVREIVLVDQDEMFVEVHRRGADGWSLDLLAGPEERLVLATAGLDTPLSEVYDAIAGGETERPPGEPEAATT